MDSTELQIFYDIRKYLCTIEEFLRQIHIILVKQQNEKEKK